jgi:sugar phosphate isomerase/epimerase
MAFSASTAIISPRSKTMLAVQTYTLREFTKNSTDAAKTLHRVKKMGYNAVQMSGHKVPIPELSKMLRDEGLICCATHEPLDKLRDQPAEIIENHHLLGCKYIAIGGYFPQTASADDWKKYAMEFNTIAAKYAGSGIQLGYHNHSHELIRYGKITALEILIQTLSPQVWLELDTYWLQHGGGDPVVWIEKVKNRIPVVHLKDMAITLKREQLMAEVGEGNMNWPAILSACKSAGVEWYAVEQDICQRDPFESLEISLRNLQEMGM